MEQSLKCYWDDRFHRNAVKLLPGDYYACDGGEVIVTVLGSCISACVYDEVLNIGGMNHFMLPNEFRQENQKNKVEPTDDSNAARYGNVAMERLINEIIKLGGNKSNMKAKIFGGGQITHSTIDVGEGNIAFSREYLGLEGVEIISEDVGGQWPRKVYFIPSTHDVFVKRIERMNNNTIVTRENSYMDSLNKTEQQGQVFFLD